MSCVFGGEGAGEEDALYGGKGNETLRECGILILNPADSPVSLLFDTRNRLNSVEEVSPLRLFLNISIDKKRVSLSMDILDHDLETIEAARLRDLDLAGETLEEVLVDDAVTGGEES